MPMSTIELVARPYARRFLEWAKDRNEVLCLSADLTGSCEIDEFRERCPERFLSLGMAEQNMMGVAAGLAREGYIPFIHTFSVFITRRAYDQVAMSIAYPNLPVRLIGFLPGLTTPGGVTHQAIDDLGLMRMVPNMTVLETGDATDVETVLDAIDGVPGPVFCRMLRGEVPRLFEDPLRINRARVLQAAGGVCIISSGICTEEAMRATAALRATGTAVTHLHVSTLKPFDDPTVAQAIEASPAGVITMENHSIIGGLGSAVAELMATSGIRAKLIRMGLQDTYAHGGSRNYLVQHYGLSARDLISRIEDVLGQSFGIDEAMLQAIALAPVRSGSRVEAL